MEKFAILTVSDKLRICGIFSQLHRIPYTVLRIGGIKPLEGDGLPGGGGGRGVENFTCKWCILMTLNSIDK